MYELAVLSTGPSDLQLEEGCLLSCAKVRGRAPARNARPLALSLHNWRLRIGNEGPIRFSPQLLQGTCGRL